MKIKYLGTAAAEGWPGTFCHCENCKKALAAGGKNLRTRSQAVIDDQLLVDFPPDTYLHMLYQGLNLPAINHVLITHTHQDHLYLEDALLRRRGFAVDIQGKLTFYGNDKLAGIYHQQAEKAPFAAELSQTLGCVELTPYVTVEIDGYKVTPLLALHDRSENCLIYVIERAGKTLLYGNDTGLFPQQSWDWLAGKKLDLVSLDCTMLVYKEGSNHMGIPDVFEVKERLESMGCTHQGTQWVVTHFSHNGRLLHHEIEEAVASHGFQVAYDGFTQEF